MLVPHKPSAPGRSERAPRGARRYSKQNEEQEEAYWGRGRAVKSPAFDLIDEDSQRALVPKLRNGDFLNDISLPQYKVVYSIRVTAMSNNCVVNLECVPPDYCGYNPNVMHSSPTEPGYNTV